MRQKTQSLSCLFIFVIGFIQAYAQQEFRPGALWPDQDGKHINAHGGGILYHGATYYWFGEFKTEGKAGNRALVGVSCYSSKDLYSWKNEGIALRVENDSTSEITKGCVIERPKVIYNRKTKKFVLWFHLELKGQGYNAARTAVAVSDHPTGPYRYIRSYRPDRKTWPINFEKAWQTKSINESDLKAHTDAWRKEVAEGLFVRRDFEKGQMSRDMTLFVDDNDKAYHIHAAEENLTLHISELSDDYLSFTGKWATIAPAGHNEAPALVKRNGKYFLITSGCTGWEPNAARSFVSNSIWGPWISLGNPAQGNNAERTFESQSTFILPVHGSKDQFIFMADRWVPDNAIDGRYIWLPLTFEEDKPVIKWFDQWNLKQLPTP
jgi:beta-xylosidase